MKLSLLPLSKSTFTPIPLITRRVVDLLRDGIGLDSDTVAATLSEM